MSLNLDIQIQPAKEAKNTVRNSEDFLQTAARGWLCDKDVWVLLS